MGEKQGDEDYQKKTQEFLAKLVEFHEKSGTPLRRIPTLGGRELDVYHLYQKVKSLGGSEAVSHARLWGEVARSFNLPASVTSASYAVRQHYVKLLDKFEVYEQDPDNYFTSIHHTPQPPCHTYLPLQQHVGASVPKLPIPSLPRVNFNLQTPPTVSYRPVSSTVGGMFSSSATGTRDKIGFDRLSRSLLSGFPNEVDLVFNILTVLAYKAPGAIPIAELPRLLGLMLGHVAVFPTSHRHGDMGLETLYHECWYPPDCGTDFMEFWWVTSPDWVCAAIFSDYTHVSLHKNSGLFSSRCDGAWAVEGYRVGQVTTILSNLVLISKFVPYLSRQEDILRFLLLASSCSLPEIRGSAMDVLIEIGPYLTVTSSASCPSPPSSPRCHSPRSNNYPVQLLEGQRSLELLIRSLFESLASPDRAAVVKSLEVLSVIGWDVSNQSILASLGKGVWQHVFKLLLLPDVQILLLCLDVLYSVTNPDNSPATHGVVSVFRWCDILVSLLSLDVRSFGEQALSKIQVVRVSPASSANSAPSSAKPSLATASGGSRGGSVGVSPISSLAKASGSSSSKIGSISSSSIPGSKLLNSGQTIRIGNFVIPVVTAANPQALGRILTSLPHPPSTSATPLTTSSGQGTKTSSLIPGSAIKVSSPLTIQQLQSLLSRANIPGATPPSSTTRSSVVGGVSSVSINRSATGGSGVTIRKVEMAPGVTESREKPLSNLLKSYLARSSQSSSSQSSSSLSSVVSSSSHRSMSPLSSSITMPSSGPTPSPTPSLSSSSASLSGAMTESFSMHWLQSNYQSSAGSYVPLEDMFSLYLSSANNRHTLGLAEFSSLVRKVFVNSLSTRVTIGGRPVAMIAGLAKKPSQHTPSSCPSLLPPTCVPATPTLNSSTATVTATVTSTATTFPSISNEAPPTSRNEFPNSASREKESGTSCNEGGGVGLVKTPPTKLPEAGHAGRATDDVAGEGVEGVESMEVEGIKVPAKAVVEVRDVSNVLSNEERDEMVRVAENDVSEACAVEEPMGETAVMETDTPISESSSPDGRHIVGDEEVRKDCQNHQSLMAEAAKEVDDTGSGLNCTPVLRGVASPGNLSSGDESYVSEVEMEVDDGNRGVSEGVSHGRGMSNGEGGYVPRVMVNGLATDDDYDYDSLLPPSKRLKLSSGQVKDEEIEEVIVPNKSEPQEVNFLGNEVGDVPVSSSAAVASAFDRRDFSTPQGMSCSSVLSMGRIDPSRSCGGVATGRDVQAVSDSSGIHSEGVSMAPSSSMSSMSSCFSSPLASSDYWEEKVSTEVSTLVSAEPDSLVTSKSYMPALSKLSASVSIETTNVVNRSLTSDLAAVVTSEPVGVVSSEPVGVVTSEPVGVISSGPVGVVSSEPNNVIESCTLVSTVPRTLVSTESGMLVSRECSVVSTEPRASVSTELSALISSESRVSVLAESSDLVSSESSVFVTSESNTSVSSEPMVEKYPVTGMKAHLSTFSSVAEVKTCSFTLDIPSQVATPISAGVIATPNLSTPPTYVSTNFTSSSSLEPSSHTSKLTTPNVTTLPIEPHSTITLATPTSLSSHTLLPANSSNQHTPSVNTIIHPLPVHLLGSSIPSQIGTSLFLTPKVCAPQVLSRSPSPATSKQPSPPVSQEHCIARQPSLPPPSPQPKPVVIRSSSTPPVGASMERSDVTRPVMTITDFKCCWSDCGRFCSSSSSLLSHVHHTHLSSITSPTSCQWTGCSSNVKRHRTSLLTHIQASHCSDQHSFSAPNISRILSRLKMAPTLQTETESPLTKAVRLSAALVLRNLARQLPEARRKLRMYEHVLCQVALSESEASLAATHCLHYMSTHS